MKPELAFDSWGIATFFPLWGWYALGHGGDGVVIYLDAFMGLNFLVDLCLMLGVNRLSGYPVGLKRAAAAAALGGGYAGACLVPGFGFLANNLWRAVSLGFMSITAFGTGKSAWRRGMLFVLLSMALGGLAISLDAGGGWDIALCAGALALLCRMGFRGNAGGEFKNVELTYRGVTLRCQALVDTGNVLRDPLTGEIITVFSAQIGEKLGIPSDPVGSMIPGVRLIPCKTVGGGGLLAAVRCEKLVIDGVQTGGLAAFARQEFGNGEYQALTGGIYG